MYRLPLWKLCLSGAACVSIFTPASWGASPSAAEALRIPTVQKDLDIDKPAEDQIAKCRVEALTDPSGWAVFGEAGQLLRKFIDSNKDQKLDQWCYYKNGIEVYRDLDTNYNGKADQYRWLGTAGTRWGLDANEDGVIDSWKMISPEEVTAEVVASIRDKDIARFQRLLITGEELRELGLGKRQLQDFQDRSATARKDFAEYQKNQKVIDSGAEWLQFGASRPGVIPAGTDGSTKDLLLYDNVAAIVEDQGKSSQLFVGTLVQVGAGWRMIDLPKSEAAGGTFVSLLNRNTSDAPNGISEQSQKLIDSLQKIDEALVKGDADRPKLQAERADTLQKLAEVSTGEADRSTWLRQYADTLGAATQSGDYPEGLPRLKKLLDQLTAGTANKDLIPHVKLLYMSSEFGRKMTSAKEAEYGKLQEQWLADLEKFATEFPNSDTTPEALLQLGLGHEFAGSDEKAADAYGRIASQFPQAPQAPKAEGAKRRLESIGKPIPLAGKTLEGKNFDLTQYRGRTVIIQYWATWCQLCLQDMQQLKTLQAKYAAKGLTVVGVNLDNDVRSVNQYLTDTPWPWPQLFAPGGMDSPLATSLGIMTLPTMILVDKTGVVVRRNVHAAELDGELSKMLK